MYMVAILYTCVFLNIYSHVVDKLNAAAVELNNRAHRPILFSLMRIKFTTFDLKVKIAKLVGLSKKLRELLIPCFRSSQKFWYDSVFILLSVTSNMLHNILIVT